MTKMVNPFRQFFEILAEGTKGTQEKLKDSRRILSKEDLGIGGMKKG